MAHEGIGNTTSCACYQVLARGHAFARHLAERQASSTLRANMNQYESSKQAREQVVKRKWFSQASGRQKGDTRRLHYNSHFLECYFQYHFSIDF
jgi:hypothetical protein